MGRHEAYRGYYYTISSEKDTIMFGASVSADRRRAGWRGALDALLRMTRLVLARSLAPPTSPIHRIDERAESRPSLWSEHELHEQHHAGALRPDEHSHADHQ
ncbi:MAG: hypothetical protein EXR66_04140 [Dehalococcoidia bacterium]|nr:hypothetical protein [Dehalococcoidia bacterium]